MYARKHGGQFILRIEDTDTKRFVPGAVENIMSSMRWLGLDWDEGPDIGGPYGPYTQTERKPLYQEWAHWLVDQGKAYKCFATSEELAQMRAQGVPFGYDRRYRDFPAQKISELEEAGKPYVIRFRMPLEGQTVVPDAIRGEIVFENSQINDYVLLKSNGLPTYHLAVVIDDHFMKISHITRGDEWINTAPLHVQLWRAFDWEMPAFVHMPVILNPSGKGKLSKRTQSFTDGEYQVLVRVEEFMEAGFLPEAVTNFLSNVGWNFGDDREKFTMEEAIRRFDFSGINPAPTRLPYSKLDWLNGQYIQEMEPAELAQKIKPYLDAAGYEVNLDSLLLIAPSMRTRLRRFPDALPFLEFLFREQPLPDSADELTHKQLPADAAAAAFREARNFVAQVEEYTLENVSAAMAAIGEKHTTTGKAGPFLGKMRFAITGQKVSPPLYESMIALGRERVLARLDGILSLLV
jgi:glutamyl-tRNA synthetase